MGRLSRLLSFLPTSKNGAKVSEAKHDPGGGPNITSPHAQPAGDDAQPLPGDFLLTVELVQTGGEGVAGYIDPNNAQKAQAGEKRIYARNPSTGATIVELWLKNDGSAILSNSSGSVTLATDGAFTAENADATLSAAADGTISGTNLVGSFELQAAGNFVVNGVTIDPSGNISQPPTATMSAGAGLTVNGQQMKDHYHTQAVDSAGDTQQNTSGPM